MKIPLKYKILMEVFDKTLDFYDEFFPINKLTCTGYFNKYHFIRILKDENFIITRKKRCLEICLTDETIKILKMIKKINDKEKKMRFQTAQ